MVFLSAIREFGTTPSFERTTEEAYGTHMNRWVTDAGAKTLHPRRLNIGPRLMIGFVFIILSMLVADAIILWQFHLVRTHAQRMSDVDQKLVAVVRAHTSIVAFYQRLDGFADEEDSDGLAAEARQLPTIIGDVQRATSALSLPPFNAQPDTTTLPTLKLVQSALPSQLESIVTLAKSGDWRAVHLRLTNQLQPLEALISALVAKIDREAGEQQAQAVLSIRRVETRIVWVVPLTAVLTLLISTVLGLAITRSITEPLSSLVEASKALARGEFQHQVSVTGKDELAHLGHVFNDTSRRLHDLYNDLQERESKIRRLVDANIVGIFIWKLNGQILEANDAFLRMVGYSREDLITGGLRWTDLTPPEWRDHDDQGRAEVQAKGSVQPYEKEYFRKDGSRVPVLVGALFQRGGNDGVAFVLELSEQKKADQERETLRRSLADLVHVNRVTTMGELTASLAHEIKQPIAAAMTNARTSLRWLDRDHPDLPEARDAISRLVKDVTRASDIINRIGSLFKKGAPQQELLNVNEVIQQMMVLLRSEASQYSISIRSDLAEGLPAVKADPVQLQQVCMNLMLNGIEAMKETGSGGELTIKSQHADNDQLLISVSDTGIGLPDQPQQIFNPFYTTKPHGSGMGLPISRSIIESHGGRLWATANKSRGATFHFTLPTAGETRNVPATQA